MSTTKSEIGWAYFVRKFSDGGGVPIATWTRCPAFPQHSSELFVLRVCYVAGMVACVGCVHHVCVGHTTQRPLTVPVVCYEIHPVSRITTFSSANKATQDRNLFVSRLSFTRFFAIRNERGH